MNYEYDEIKKMNKKELNNYGNFFDFIYWIVSENNTFDEIIGSLKKVFTKMGEEIFKDLSLYLSLKTTNYENFKKKSQKIF